MKGTDEFYKNGRPVFVLVDNTKTYFYKSGMTKATGPFINNCMEGEWKFFYESGELFQIGHLKNDIKHGKWVRYKRSGEIEYAEEFTEGKKIKKTNA